MGCQRGDSVTVFAFEIEIIRATRCMLFVIHYLYGPNENDEREIYKYAVIFVTRFNLNVF